MFGFLAESSNLENVDTGAAANLGDAPLTRKARYGLPAESAMEPLIHAPLSPVPATEGQTAAHQSVPVASHERAIHTHASSASSVERIDKVWVVATIDQEIARMTYKLDHLKDEMDSRLHELQAVVARVGHKVDVLESQAQRHGSHLGLLRQETTSNRQSLRQSNISPQSHVENMVRSLREDVRETADFIREETKGQIKDALKVVEAEGLTFRSCVAGLQVQSKNFDTKLLKQNLSSSLFTLEVADMDQKNRQRIMEQLNKQREILASPTPSATGEEDDALALSAAMQQFLNLSRERQINAQQNSLVQRGEEKEEGTNSPEGPAADFISPLAPSVDAEHAFEVAEGVMPQADLSDQYAQKCAYQQELKALDSKLSLLILSSNLFCIKAAVLPSAARTRFTAAIEMLLAKRKTHHGGIGMQDLINSLKDAEIIGFGQDQISDVLSSPEIPEAGSLVEKTSGPEPASNKAQAAGLQFVDGTPEEKVVECRI